MTENGCQQCGKNTYSGDGAESCASCPDGKISDAGSTTEADCEYGKEHYGLNFIESLKQLQYSTKLLNLVRHLEKHHPLSLKRNR